MDLIADIGATTTRCGLLDDRGKLTAPEEFRNVDFTGIPGLLKIYLDHRRASDQPRRAASLTKSAPSQLGKPCPRLIASCSRARAVISLKMVTPKAARRSATDMGGDYDRPEGSSMTTGICRSVRRW